MADEALTVSPTRVAVLNINPGVVSHEFFGSMLNLVAHDVSHAGHISVVMPQTAGGLCHMYRNSAIERALANTEQPWDVILFVDSDMMFHPTILDELLPYVSPERPVVSAVYTMMLDDGPRLSICYRREDDAGQMRMTPIKVSEMPENQLIECDGIGAGFMLIHRSLIEEMLGVYGSPMPWFETEVYDGIFYGEDYTFCMRMDKLGYKPFVHTGIEAEHVSKKTVLNIELAKRVEDEQRSNDHA